MQTSIDCERWQDPTKPKLLVQGTSIWATALGRFLPLARGRNRPKVAFESNAQLQPKSGHSIYFSGTIKLGKNEL
jgi:hypothetical protein